jgi:hypothetical protein
MTKPVLLNNIDHKDLRIATGRGKHYGDDVMSALTFPGEFRQLQACYPIVFAKSADGVGFQCLALFGFQQGENLFLDGATWDAPYLPLAIERQPFLIGRGGGELTVHVDLEHPRIDPAGQPVFLPHGGTTPYIERINSTLLALHEGLESAPAFIAALLENELLESFVLDIELDDGSQNRLAGFYTINEDRLAALAPAAVERLHRAGHLEALYMALASLAQFRNLIDRKNRRNAADR